MTVGEPELYRVLPEWHVNSTLKRAVQLSEVRRQCTYVHLEREISGLDASSVLLISGSRDSYVTPEIASRLHEVVGGSASLWIADGAKHNMSRSVQTEEYDRRVVSHVEKCLGSDVLSKPGQSSSRGSDPAVRVLQPYSPSSF